MEYGFPDVGMEWESAYSLMMFTGLGGLGGRHKLFSKAKMTKIFITLKRQKKMPFEGPVDFSLLFLSILWISLLLITTILSPNYYFGR